MNKEEKQGRKNYNLLFSVIWTVGTLFFLQLTSQNYSHTVMSIKTFLTSRFRNDNSVFYKPGNIVHFQCTAALHSPLKTNECFEVVFFLSLGRLRLGL